MLGATRCCTAIDPGWKNLGIWKGYRTANGTVVRDHWEKYDITNNNKKPGGVYAQIVDLLEKERWIYTNEHENETPDFKVIIESQDPTNVTARILAATMYGYFRAKNVPVKFSGSYSKAKAKIKLALGLNMYFDQSECTGTAESRAAYTKTKRSSYEIVQSWVNKNGSLYDKEFVNSHNEKKGDKKGDDIAECFLLGYADLFEKELKTIKIKKDEKKEDQDAGAEVKDGEEKKKNAKQQFFARRGNRWAYAKKKPVAVEKEEKKTEENVEEAAAAVVKEPPKKRRRITKKEKQAVDAKLDEIVKELQNGDADKTEEKKELKKEEVVAPKKRRPRKTAAKPKEDKAEKKRRKIRDASFDDTESVLPTVDGKFKEKEGSMIDRPDDNSSAKLQSDSESKPWWESQQDVYSTYRQIRSAKLTGSALPKQIRDVFQVGSVDATTQHVGHIL